MPSKAKRQDIPRRNICKTNVLTTDAANLTIVHGTDFKVVHTTLVFNCMHY